MIEKFFSPKGRVNRLQNIGYELLMVLIMMILGTIIATIVLGVGYFIGAYDDSLNSGVSTITPLLGIELILISIPTILAIYSNIIIKIKRLHDINLSGWWFPVFLLLCLPYIALYFWPGTKGKNRFDENYKSQEKDLNDTSLTKAVYNHSKNIASEIKPKVEEYKREHSSQNESQETSHYEQTSNNIEIKNNDEERIKCPYCEKENNKSRKICWKCKKELNKTKNAYPSNIEDFDDSYFSNIKKNTDSGFLTEDQIYEKVMIEIEEDKKVKSIWAKSLAQSDGNKDKAESLYINLRVKYIKDDYKEKK